MPEPTNPNSGVDLSTAPGADINFDDLFPVEAESLVVAPPQAAPGTNPPAAAPQAPQGNEFFLQGNTSRYKTAEEAIKGLDTKDAMIDNYRNFLKTKGINPDTLEAVQPEPQAPSTPQSPYKYLNNEQKLYEDLARQARTDPAAWGRTLREYNQEVLSAQVAPILPLLTEVSRQRAVRQVSQEATDFPTFIGSPAYSETLNKVPILKQAIENAENNFNMADSLPQLYQLAYMVGQNFRKPEPVAAPAAPAPVAATPQHPARPTTTSPSYMTPPQPGAPPDMRTSAGRKALIQDMEARGIKDFSF